MSKSILPENNKGELHGYCESYYSDGQLWWKGVFVNGYRHGYCEFYWDGNVNKKYTGYFLGANLISNDNEKGYCYIWCKGIVDG